MHIPAADFLRESRLLAFSAFRMRAKILRRAPPQVSRRTAAVMIMRAAPPLEEASAARTGHRRTALPDEEAGAALRIDDR